MDFRVIGAGLPRTGTLSTMHALEIILPGGCHHMKKALYTPDIWADILAGRASDEEFKQFFVSNNEVAAVDAPFCFAYERAMKVFPNAKVLLTVREPETWVKSMKETIFKRRFLDPTFIFAALRLFPTYLNQAGDSAEQETKKWPVAMFTELEKVGGLQRSIRDGTGVDYFNNWVRGVERTVPKERLLKFHVKEGWEPLCKFLDVPVPDVPFPRVNSAGEFDERGNMVYRRAWVLLYEIVSLPAWIYAIYQLTRS